MTLKITTKPAVKNDYCKVYLKLVALEFTPNVSDKVLKTPKLRVEYAKEYYKENYRNLCIDLSKCDW